MIHTFEEILTRTPANPSETASEAAMPQARMGSPPPGHGPGPPSPQHPISCAGGSRPPTPGHGPSTTHRPRHHPTTSTPDRERAKERPTARGRGEAPGDRQAPTETGHRGQQNTGARNHRRTTNTGEKMWGSMALWERAQGRAQGHKPRRRGTPHGRDRHRPTPPTKSTPCDPKMTRPHQGTGLTTMEAHARPDALPQPGPDTARCTQGSESTAT